MNIKKIEKVQNISVPFDDNTSGRSVSVAFVSSDFPDLQISSSALLDIQLTLFCVCGVDSFLPELEHL